MQLLKEFYARVQMTGKVVSSGYSSAVDYEEQELSLLGNGRSRRLDWTWIKSVNPGENGGAGVVVSGPLSFRASRKPGKTDFTLLDYDLKGQSDYDERIRFHAPFAEAPFAFREVLLSDLFRSPECTKIDVVPDAPDRDIAQRDQAPRVVTVDCEFQFPDNRFPLLARLEFLPDHHWALKAYSWGKHDRAELTYQFHEDGFPELLEVRESRLYWSYEGDAVSVTTITSFDRTKAAEDRFIPQSLGIDFPAHSWSSLAPAVLVAGILLVAVGLAIARRQFFRPALA